MSLKPTCPHRELAHTSSPLHLPFIYNSRQDPLKSAHVCHNLLPIFAGLALHSRWQQNHRRLEDYSSTTAAHLSQARQSGSHPSRHRQPFTHRQVGHELWQRLIVRQHIPYLCAQNKENFSACTFKSSVNSQEAILHFMWHHRRRLESSCLAGACFNAVKPETRCQYLF